MRGTSRTSSHTSTRLRDMPVAESHLAAGKLLPNPVRLTFFFHSDIIIMSLLVFLLGLLALKAPFDLSHVWG
jgi:hypothetical protein